MEMYKRPKAILVEYEFHYGFLELMIIVLLGLGCDVEIYCTKNFELYFERRNPKVDAVKFHSSYSMIVGTYKAIRASKTAKFFIHFSVQAYKFGTILRLKKPEAEINILYTPRLSNWHLHDWRIPKNKSEIVDLYFNLFRRLIVKKYSHYIVHSSQAKQEIVNKINAKVISLPYYFRNPSHILEQHDNSSTSSLNIAILGSVDRKRRDYLSVFDPELTQNMCLEGVKVTIAGVPNGSDFRSKNHDSDYFRLLKSNIEKISKNTGLSFYFFQSRLSDLEYNSVIVNSHLLLMPVNICHYPAGGWSAGLAESIQFDRRICIPSVYELPSDYPKDYLEYKNPRDFWDLLVNAVRTGRRFELSGRELNVRKNIYSVQAIGKVLQDEVS